MPIYKMTWFFEGFQNAEFGAGSSIGWTETWALNLASGSIDAAFTAPDVTKYTFLRQSCLSNAYRMSFLRASLVPGNGLGVRLVKVQTLNNQRGALSAPTSPASQVQCCVLGDLMKLPAGGTDKVHHRKFLLRGITTDIINGNVLNTGGAAWPAVKNLFDFLGQKQTGGAVVPGGATQLGILYQDPSFTKKPMPNMSTSPTSDRVILLEDLGPPWLAGDQIRISGFTGLDGVAFNRIWQFISSQTASPPATSAFGKSRFDLSTVNIQAPNQATYQTIRYLAGPFDQYAIIGLRSKRTGRVFHQLRGRSARKVRP